MKMQRLCLLGLIAFGILPLLASAKPKMTVQLYAQQVEYKEVMQFASIYVIFSDGHQARAGCAATAYDHPCVIEPFHADQRKSQPCVDHARTMQVTCIYNEVYSADRTGNDLAIYAQNGKVSYKIDGTWDTFEVGTLVPVKPAFDPNWKAICKDGTFSYSQTPSGTCSDHGGVSQWKQ